MKVLVVLFILLFSFVKCGYQPSGYEVQAGSVLLPATRRGRYLANIVRRQAVDGTGIKFNQDADRMNAEAKKKVDVLSEELLPYIIAEQERRTTLYKRVMTAIQNGEKGVTIAEIRNKPPLLIKRGVMFRCPTNRAPKEPDGTGILMCDDNIEPKQIMYDSCLSAEDKDLYRGPDYKYFFCNRKLGEGPDLPRNGTSTIGCSPSERTSYNYTTKVCSLEDTDDVVVHYRYYPDRTYKYVTELDPDREVCDHWNPCQIGYIYSLPSADQALTTMDIYQIVPQDFQTEFIPPNGGNYTISTRRIPIPPGYNFTEVIPGDGDGRRWGWFTRWFWPKVKIIIKIVLISIKISTTKLNDGVTRSFDGNFVNKQGHNKKVRIASIKKSTINVVPVIKHAMPGRPLNNITIEYTCNGCVLQRILVRNPTNVKNSVQYADPSRYQINKNSVCICSNHILMPKDFGDCFGVFKNKEGKEENVKLITVIAPEDVFKSKVINKAVKPSDQYEDTIEYVCEGCTITDILCNGESGMKSGRVTLVPESKRISFNFPRFEDSHACVYLVIFKKPDNVTAKSTVATLENASPDVTIPLGLTVEAIEGDQFVMNVSFVCNGCTVEKVGVNGLELTKSKEQNDGSIPGSYQVYGDKIHIEVPEFSKEFYGVYQALFLANSAPVTKTILNIQSKKEKGEKAEGDTPDKPEESPKDDNGTDTDNSTDTNGTDTSDNGNSSDTAEG